MTVWEHLVANSTLNEADGDAWEHLTHPSGTGGSGAVIHSEQITISESSKIWLKEANEDITILGEPDTHIQAMEDAAIIKEIEGDEIDGIC